jgi:hypothetical protein
LSSFNSKLYSISFNSSDINLVDRSKLGAEVTSFCLTNPNSKTMYSKIATSNTHRGTISQTAVLADEKRQVRFGNTQVHLHGLVVGDQQDRTVCPLQLDWASSNHVAIYPATEYGTLSAVPHKLSSRQRRNRLAQVNGIRYHKVFSLEIEQASRYLQQIALQIMTTRWKSGAATDATPRRVGRQASLVT